MMILSLIDRDVLVGDIGADDLGARVRSLSLP